MFGPQFQSEKREDIAAGVIIDIRLGPEEGVTRGTTLPRASQRFIEIYLTRLGEPFTWETKSLPDQRGNVMYGYPGADLGDWFPKRGPKAQASWGVQGHAPPVIFLDFNSLKSPFLDFRVIQIGYWPVPFILDEALQLGKFFYLSIIYLLWKIGSISVKRRKPVWICAWVSVLQGSRRFLHPKFKTFPVL